MLDKWFVAGLKLVVELPLLEPEAMDVVCKWRIFLAWT